VFSFNQLLKIEQLQDPLCGEPRGFAFPGPGQLRLCGQKDTLLEAQNTGIAAERAEPQL